MRQVIVVVCSVWLSLGPPLPGIGRVYGAAAPPPASAVRLERAPEAVGCFDHAEFVVRVEHPPFENPFSDGSLTGVFVAPDGSKLAVDGFADAQDGSVYRLRFCPQKPGVTYDYALRLRGGGIDRRFTGKLRCKPSSRSGPVIVDPDHPKHFKFAGTGKPFYHLGYTAYHLLDVSNDDASVDATLDYCARGGFNKIRFLLTGYPRNVDNRPVSPGPYVAPEGNPWHVPNYGSRPGQVNPLPAWLGEPHHYDFSRFNVAYWQRIDRAVRGMRDRGIVANCIFTIEKQGLPKEYGALTDAEHLLYRYAVARLAAFDNVWWDLGNEYLDYRETDWPDAIGPFVRKLDPYPRLTSVHSQQEFRFGGSAWADFIITQQTGDEKTIHDWVLKYQATPKPYINEEYGYEGDRDKPGHRLNHDWVRRCHWSIAMAGGYATYGDWSGGISHYYMGETGNGKGAVQLEHLRSFFESVPFSRLTVRDELTDSGFCLALPPSHYVFYFPRGGKRGIKLDPAAGAPAARWYDPRTGRRQEGPTLRPGKNDIVCPPGGDWVLHVTTAG